MKTDHDCPFCKKPMTLTWKGNKFKCAECKEGIVEFKSVSGIITLLGTLIGIVMVPGGIIYPYLEGHGRGRGMDEFAFVLKWAAGIGVSCTGLVLIVLCAVCDALRVNSNNVTESAFLSYFMKKKELDAPAE